MNQRRKCKIKYNKCNACRKNNFHHFGSVYFNKQYDFVHESYN